MWRESEQLADRFVVSKGRRRIPVMARPIGLTFKSLSLERPGSDIVTQDINVLALVKGSERYIFLFDDNRRAETLRTLGRYASNPDLNFSWYDAAVLSQKVRQTVPAEPVRTERRFEMPS